MNYIHNVVAIAAALTTATLALTVALRCHRRGVVVFVTASSSCCRCHRRGRQLAAIVISVTASWWLQSVHRHFNAAYVSAHPIAPASSLFLWVLGLRLAGVSDSRAVEGPRGDMAQSGANARTRHEGALRR
jgi:hypothetical protein